MKQVNKNDFHLKYISWIMETETDPEKREAYNKYYKVVEDCEKFIQKTTDINGIEIDTLVFAKHIFEKDEILPLRIYGCPEGDPSIGKHFKIDAWSGIREEYKKDFPDSKDGVKVQLYRSIKRLTELL